MAGVDFDNSGHFDAFDAGTLETLDDSGRADYSGGDGDNNGGCFDSCMSCLGCGSAGLLGIALAVGCVIGLIFLVLFFAACGSLV